MEDKDLFRLQAACRIILLKPQLGQKLQDRLFFFLSQLTLKLHLSFDRGDLSRAQTEVKRPGSDSQF